MAEVSNPFNNRIHITDLPYKPQYEPSTFARAKKWLEAKRPGASGNATFAQIWDPPKGEKTGQMMEHLDAVCHAHIHNNARNVALIASVIKDPVTDNEPFRHRWYQWLFEESPYRHFILSDLDFAKVGIILSADMPAPLLQNILILTRHGWEISHKAYKLWESCVNDGTPGWLAYATIMNSKAAFSGYGGQVPQPFEMTDYYLPHTNQHRAHWLMNFQTLTNFRHEVVGLHAQRFVKNLVTASQTYRTNTSFYGGCMLFDDTERNMNSDHYVTQLLSNPEFMETIKGRRLAVRASIPNPFGEQIVPAGGLTYKDIVEVAMPFVLEHGLTDIPVHDQIKEPANAASAGVTPVGARRGDTIRAAAAA